MATTIISIPSGLCFSGNLPQVTVDSDAEVRVQLKCGANSLLDETYTPDANNRVKVDIADIVINELALVLPTSNTFVQQNIRKDFSLVIQSSTFNFSVFRAGVKDLSVYSQTRCVCRFWIDLQVIIKNLEFRVKNLEIRVISFVFFRYVFVGDFPIFSGSLFCITKYH